MHAHRSFARARQPGLDEALHALPGRKLIFTNGTVAHAEKVLARLGITHHFGDIFDIVHSDFIPKPEMQPYREIRGTTGVRPKTSAMFEDIARNLEAPHALGMTTVLVTSPDNHDAEKLNSASGGIEQPHVHHVTSDLAGFLNSVNPAQSNPEGETPVKNAQSVIEQAWEDRANVTLKTKGNIRKAVEHALGLLDSGKARVAEKVGWRVAHQPVAEEGRAALLPPQRHGADRRRPRQVAAGGTRCRRSSMAGARTRFREAGFRAVPNCIVRRSAYIAPGVVLMPSFVNLGAYVDEGTMVDTWATVGSCAQIGKNVHLSGGVGIGGVLEPMQAGPTIIEDNCFIGARSEVVEGVIVGEGSVISMGVFIGQSTKIVDRATGEVHMGKVPPYSVVVSGSLPRQALRRRLARPVALLRRHRQARR